MLRSSFVLLALAISGSAAAEQFDYTWLSIGYGNVEYDDVDVDGDGFGIDGSYALSDDFHIFGDYTMSNLDFGVDGTSFGAGIGYNAPVSPVVDVVARLSYQYVELDVPGFGSVDDNGFGIGVGMRFAATERLEVNAGIDYIDLSDSGDDTALGIGGLYDVTETFALGLAGNWSDDVSSFTLTGRFYFGGDRSMLRAAR